MSRPKRPKQSYQREQDIASEFHGKKVFSTLDLKGGVLADPIR